MSRLSHTISQRTCLDESDVKSVLDCMNECIADELATNGKSSINGLGTLSLDIYPSRVLHNIHTGKKEATREKTVVKFKVSDKFKNKFNPIA